MKRRTALTTMAAVSLSFVSAGCLDAGPADDPADGTETDDGGADDANETSADDPTTDDDEYTYRVSLPDTGLRDSNRYGDLEVELLEATIGPDSPAQVSVTLTNTTDETIVASSGAPGPFGVLWGTPTGGDHEDRITLWNDAYEESSHVGTDGKHVEGVNDIAIGTELDAGESVTKQFELYEETPNLQATTYEVEFGPSVRTDDNREYESLTVAFELIVEARSGDDADGADDEPADDDSSDETVEYELLEDTDLTVKSEYDNTEAVRLLESSSAVTEVFEDDRALESLLEQFDFDNEALLFIQLEAPQTCYRTAVYTLEWRADDAGYVLEGAAGIERTAPADQPCGDAITYPHALVRVTVGDREVTGLEIDGTDEDA